MSIEQTLSEENARFRKAGCILAEAASKVIRDYDGLHRLALAISAWYAVIADEGGRSINYEDKEK